MADRERPAARTTPDARARRGRLPAAPAPTRASAANRRLVGRARRAEYLAEHGDFLGDDDFVWCPEGLREDDARAARGPSELAGRDVLEVGCGAAQCSRWLAAQGARVVGLDLSAGMLAAARAPAAPDRGRRLVQADARALPFADGSFDLACSAYGAVPFVADPRAGHGARSPGCCGRAAAGCSR